MAVSGFVPQDDVLMEVLSPRESMTFAAKLKLGSRYSDAEIDRIVEQMLNDLGLSACADTRVGGDLTRGVSGGERKRTSIGYELVADPAVLFLDEPTTGLDSFTAVQIINLMKF